MNPSSPVALARNVGIRIDLNGKDIVLGDDGWLRSACWTIGRNEPQATAVAALKWLGLTNPSIGVMP